MRARVPSWTPFALLALILLIHVALVAGNVRGRGVLDHDEVISQMAATGHLDDWQRVIDDGEGTGKWGTGDDLRRYLEVDDNSTPGAVRQNLTDHDIHPPLYFWALWAARSTGIDTLWSGPLLNLAAVILAGVVLYSLLIEVLADRLLTVLAIGVFAFSPALIQGVGYNRQYAFLMLAVVSLIWVTAHLLRRPNSPWLLGALFAVGLFGLLTAHQFVFAFAGALLVMAVRWWRTDLRALALAGATVIASGLAALAIHPGFFTQYDRSTFQISFAPATSRGARVQAWVRGFFDLVDPDTGASRAFEVLALVAAVALLVTLPWWYRTAVRTIRSSRILAATTGVTGTALVGATAAYLLGRAPSHAVGWQYVIIYWPGFVILGAALIRRKAARPALTLAIVVLLLGTYAWRWDALYSDQRASGRRAADAVSDATLVVADCLKRGYTPGAGRLVQPDARFLLLARDPAAPPPSIPADADRSRPVLLHTDGCQPAAPDIDGLLRRLGYTRGERIGLMGSLWAYRLTPDAGGPAPSATGGAP